MSDYIDRENGIYDYTASKCVTGPYEGLWRVEIRQISYMKDGEYDAFAQLHKPAKPERYIG